MLTFTTVSPVVEETYYGISVGGYSRGSTNQSNYSGTGFIDSESNVGAGGFTAGTTTRLGWSSSETVTSESFSETESGITEYASGSTAFPPSSEAATTASWSDSSSRSTISSKVSLQGDTSYATSAVRSEQSSYSSGSTLGTVSGGIINSGTLSVTSYPTGTVPSSTARTASTTSSETFRETYTYGYRSETFATTNSDCLRYTTSSSTDGQWGTDTTLETHDITETSIATDTDGELTVEGDNRRTRTETFGTTGGTRIASSFASTTSHHRMLQDTVYMLSDGGSDFLLGHMVWTMPSSVVTAESYTGKFTDLYQASSGNSFTISDYQKSYTDSLALPVVSISRGTANITTQTGTGTSETATSNIPATYTNGFSIYSTEAHTQTISLGAVGTSLSTHSAGSSTTRFTVAGFVSGYLTSGDAEFTTGTTTSGWGSTSSTGGHEAWAESYTTTATGRSRSVTTDEVLRDVHTATTVIDTYTGLSFLGLSRYTTSRIIGETITVTITNWHTGLTCSNFSYTVVNDNSDTIAGNNGFTGTTIVTASHDYTLSTKGRLAAQTESSRYNPPIGNEAWMTTPARGWAGFCGSFTQTSPAIYLTTTSGLAAGATFADAFPAIYLGTKALNADGVKIVPCHESTGITLGGIGLVKSSLISAPTALASAVSIAATWTSTTEAGTSAVTSTRSATHTAAMAAPIMGNYWTSQSLTMDSENQKIGRNGPHASYGGYVAGDNRMGSHEVRVNAGAVSWTQFTASASDTTGVTGATSGTDESASFTVPQGAAVRVAVEPVYTVRWVRASFFGTWNGDHAMSTTPHQDFIPPP